MGYTKGKWDIEGCSKRDITISAEDKIIAEVWLNDNQPEGEANAHLIASAPDLYEALKGMLKGYDPEEHWNNAIGKGLKALAKAEGK